ncbi:MAG: hypothetical protein GC152_02565 [Alphaproteobacteria bacterium]|nr:hypothetical protein [Alphaproteobacteria bacterium]
MAGALLAAAACTTTETSSVADATPAKAAEEEAQVVEASATEEESQFSDSDMICKVQKVTGSRFGRKRCMTRYEWRIQMEQSQEGLQNLQRRSLQQDVPNSG